MLEERQERIRRNKMAIMKYEIFDDIKYHIDNKLLLTVERLAFESNVHRGFPVKITNDFLLMTNIIDFHNEGYILLRCADVTNAYSKESDVFYENICISEGLQKEIEKCKIDISKNVHSILNQLNEINSFITIHCEKETEKCNFFMGQIKNIKDDYVEFLSLDVDGKWDRETDIIYFSDITMISVDDHYAKMFYKYVK